MKKFNTNANAMKMFMLFTVLLMMGFSHGDTNFHPGNMCDELASSPVDPTFTGNLNSFVSSLPTNVVLHHGFYKTRVGEGPNTIYGIIQCRGDISSSNCTNCTREAIRIAVQGCPTSRDVTIWFRWCMLRYSNVSIFGVWEKNSMETPIGNGTDDITVNSKGRSMMNMLASTTPNQPGMVQTSVVDVGKGRKRYGLAQCRRDLNKSDCGLCLDDQLESFREQIWNQTGWEIYGSSCSMWYNDFKFYSNISTIGISDTGDEEKSHGESSGSDPHFDAINIYTSSVQGMKKQRMGRVLAAFISLTLSIFTFLQQSSFSCLSS